jgi:hypothetical protein
MSDLTTKEKVKLQLGISGTTDDTLIDDIIAGISAQIETFCNREFTEATYTEYFDTTDGNNQKLFLRNTPVSSLTSVQYRGGTWGTPIWHNFIADYYFLTSNIGRVAFAGKLPEEEDYVKIVYVGGYKIDFTHETDITKHTLPADLEAIATDMVCQSYNLRATGGIKSESTEGQSVTFGEMTSVEIEKKLAPYRNYNI